MRALLASWLVLGGSALAAVPSPAVLTGVHAADPPHCLSAGQWQDPVADAPMALFDGDPQRPWVICPEAATEGYSVDFTFEAPVAIDGLRLHAGPAGGNYPQVVEIGLHDTRLSTRYPVHFRRVKLEAGQAVEVAFQGRLPWNPRLVEDEAFGARRRAQGLDPHDVPLPLTFDKITVVLRALDASAGPVQLGELSFRFRDATVPIKGLAAVRTRHTAFLQQGLEHVLAKRFLVGAERAVHLAGDGRLMDVTRADWDAGHWFEPERREQLGTWRIERGRLEMRPLRHRNRPFEPVDYRIDHAPQQVELRTGPAKGTWKVVTGAPRPDAAPAEATAATTPEPEAEGDALGGGADVIPIP